MPRGSSVEVLLKKNGAMLIRQRKHLIYQLPNGRRIAVSGSPSDWRALRNQMAQIRRALGGSQDATQ